MRPSLILSEVSSAPSRGRKWNLLSKIIPLIRNGPQANAPTPFLVRRDLVISFFSFSTGDARIPAISMHCDLCLPYTLGVMLCSNHLEIFVSREQGTSYSFSLGLESYVADPGENHHVKH